MNKRGVFFSTDALIALVIILITVGIAYPVIMYSNYDTSVQSDIMNVLSSLKIGEINNNYVKQLINDGKINDLNKSVLEQIGEFYSENITMAQDLAYYVLSDLDIKDNIGVLYGNTLVFSSNTSSYENSKNVMVDRQTISGIHEGGDVTGFSARSFLTGSSQKKYYYFGGYLGEGNISININYNGNLTGISLEIASNKDFKIFINNIFSGQYENSSTEFSPQNYDLSAYIGNFNSGDNTIKISGDNLYIAGGYLKIIYTEPETDGETRYYFPGIEGLINIYDGIYVPGELNNMNIYLHYNSNASIFLNLGNITVFTGNSSGGDTVKTVDNSQLTSLLDYNELSEKTIPLRVGIENISYSVFGKKDVDVFSVDDISGSMAAVCSDVSCGRYTCCGSNCNLCNNNKTKCLSCGGNWEDKIGDTKNATKSFIDIVLNNSGSRVGLVAYSTSALDANYHSLSNNTVSLKNRVDSWNAVGGTCICCGINKAVNGLITDSTPDKFRSIVVMSDGQPTYYCNSFDDFDGSGTRGDWTGGTENTNDIEWAINSSCNAWKNYGIRVYAVGFGDNVDTATMQAMAACGNGSYYYSDVSNLTNVYNQIASDIIQGSYNEQTVLINGSFFTKLYPDSYIEFDYTKNATPYGLITSFEKQFYNDYYGNFSLPLDSKIIDAKVVSYSGPRWTSNVEINNQSIYNLSYYGTDYTKFGDPYAITLPNSMISNSNLVKVSTGTSPQNSTSGSSNNKIIYSILRNMTSYNSSIYSVAEGCLWTIDFEDSTNASLKVPQNYSGPNTCYYQPGRELVYNDNDAIELAVFNMLKLLDIDSNGKIDIRLEENNLQLSITQISGIPYSWSTEVKIIRWD